MPARWGASRLPGKPLAAIGDLPLVEHVRRRALLVRGVERVLVATDDERIAEVVRAFGGEAVLTGTALSGTHRCRLALDALGDWPDVVVNVQGDQPLLEPAHVEAAVAALTGPIATVCAPLAGDPGDPHRVKVVCDPDGRALYFSRAPIPYGGPWLQHGGIYAFTADGLRAATGAVRSPLCLAEDLEQVAWLEAGLAIAVARVDGIPRGVDTPDQLAEARRLITI